jgi:hypothetical protein
VSRAGLRVWPAWTIAAVGVGLVLAPVVFQMFTRAPGGATMIDGFRPYMSTKVIADFRHDLTVIGAASDEAQQAVATQPAGTYPSVRSWNTAWSGIDADMGSMLTTMDTNIGNYRGVAALPPFGLFPWFFVAPGLLLAGLGTTVALRRRRGRADGRAKVALALVGLGLVAAPFAFQMFGRAPGGATMIDGFRPFMTHAKVAQIQGYFLTIGAGEGQARLQLEPALHGRPTPALATLHREWPQISATMAPMIGAMADNVDNYLGVAALPPFTLFPWFFVIPGVGVAALALVRPRPSPGADLAADDPAVRIPA